MVRGEPRIGLRPRGDLLAAVLVLPLSEPVLIFGGLATAGAISDPEHPHAFLLLAAITLAALALAPFAAAAAL